jgi:two-component system, NarL family, sensor histidine kinase LiaS
LDSAGERIALARALHDGLAQDLVALRYRVEFLADSTTLDISHSRELKRISLEISEITARVRDELFNLREPQLLRQKSSDFLLGFEDLISPYRRQISIRLKSNFGSMPAHLGDLISHITHELIRNTLRHAGASLIEIEIMQRKNSLQFNFSDNGVGGARESEHRFGLTGIRELVELNLGSFSIIDKGGTCICLNFLNKKSSL